MKNVIYIIIDAFCFNNLELKIGNEYVTPFLRKLMDKSFSFGNMYSQAPYTEASQVTLLSGENCLDNGGYLFGNGNVQHSIFEDYLLHGYHTIFSYSPYVYSKGYLRGVEKYYYTRMYSIEPLFQYRLKYYKDKLLYRIINRDEIETCIILLSASFEEWLDQISDILNEDEKTILIRDMSPSKKVLNEIKVKLICEKKQFEQGKKEYINRLFKNWDDSELRKINKQYNVVPKFKLHDNNLKKYQDKLNRYQKKISSIHRSQGIDLKYLFSMLYRNKNGLKDFKHTLENYYRHYTTKFMSNYLTSLDKDYKTEASMKKTFDCFFNTIKGYDKKKEAYFAYIHVQDFHLPSVFHSIDVEDESIVDEEFREAFSLLDKITKSNYKGNILTALSAHFCDLKLRDFYDKLKKELQENFIFVVTADHGYPCYNNPPRPMIYNQTYTEAFHIPLIINSEDSSLYRLSKELQSNMDAVDIVKNISYGKEFHLCRRDFILCEYGGPGCPAICEKPIWYTYIDGNLRVSIECKIEDDISINKVKSIYNTKSDPYEKYDLVKKDINIERVINIVNKRHLYLRNRYSHEKFYNTLFTSLNRRCYCFFYESCLDEK